MLFCQTISMIIGKCLSSLMVDRSILIIWGKDLSQKTVTPLMKKINLRTNL
jgi:hypothetical protein